MKLCFWRCGFLDVQSEVDDNIPLSYRYLTKSLQRRCKLNFEKDDEYIDCDTDVPTADEIGLSSSDEIRSQILIEVFKIDDSAEEITVDENELEEDELPVHIAMSSREAMDCVDRVKNYLLSRNLGYLLAPLAQYQPGVGESAYSSMKQCTFDSLR